MKDRKNIQNKMKKRKFSEIAKIRESTAELQFFKICRYLNF